MNATWLFSSRLLRLLIPLAFGLAGAFVLTGAWAWHFQVELPRAQAPPIATSNAQAHSWTAVILDANILGLDIPEQAPDTPEPVDISAPFDVRLLGTVTGIKPRAVVRHEDVFMIAEPGDVIDGWTLEEVLTHSAVFGSGDRREEVLLWTGAPEPEGADTAVRPQEAPAWSAPGSSIRVSLSREEAQPLLSDPNSLLQMASFKPFTVDGRVNGFQVLSIRPDSVLYRVGLRNGDVLARINGQTLTGPTQLLQAYAGMDRSSLITLDVQRASRMQSFIVELN